MPRKLKSSRTRLNNAVEAWIEDKLTAKKMAWEGLFSIQEQAIEHFMKEPRPTSDVIIAAPTAGGKTMAAFLPLMSLARSSADADKHKGYFRILYLSPLIALLKQMHADDHDITRLHKVLKLKSVIWHGERSQDQKDSDVNPRNLGKGEDFGALMTTPESLESMLTLRPERTKRMLGKLTAIVVDELHSYFDTPRGRHLISLLARLDHLIGRSVPRVALSATLGDRYTDHKRDPKKERRERERIAGFLRPSLVRSEMPFDPKRLKEITNPDRSGNGRSEEAGFEISLEVMASKDEVARKLVCLAQPLTQGGEDRRTSALVFANSRHDVEHYSSRLSSTNEQPLEHTSIEFPDAWFLSENHRKLYNKAVKFLEGKEPAATARPDQTDYADLQVRLEKEAEEASEATRSALAAQHAQRLRRVASPNLFWPHHASLKPADRNHAELRMREEKLPCAIICTTTLELGIDVGPVDDVTQIDPAPSVTALRQRLGRSRRQAYADPEMQKPKLNILLHEPTLSRDEAVRNANPMTGLRIKTFQAVAQSILLRERVYESPRDAHLDVSTMVLQVLNFMNGRATQTVGPELKAVRKAAREKAEAHAHDPGEAETAIQEGEKAVERLLKDVRVPFTELAGVLCENGPFAPHRGSTRQERENSLLEVVESLTRQVNARLRFEKGEISLTLNGRAWVNKPDIYAAFASTQEVTVKLGAVTVGTLSTRRPVGLGDTILLSGRALRVVARLPSGALQVIPAPAALAPHFEGSLVPISGTVIQKMKELYLCGSYTSLEKEIAKHRIELLGESSSYLRQGWTAAEPLRKVANDRLDLPHGRGTYYLPWRGHRHIAGLKAILEVCHISAIDVGLAIFVRDLRHSQIEALVKSRWPQIEEIDPEEQIRGLVKTSIGKFRREVSDALQRKDFVSSAISFTAAKEIFRLTKQTADPQSDEDQTSNSAP